MKWAIKDSNLRGVLGEFLALSEERRRMWRSLWRCRALLGALHRGWTDDPVDIRCTHGSRRGLARTRIA